VSESRSSYNWLIAQRLLAAIVIGAVIVGCGSQQQSPQPTGKLADAATQTSDNMPPPGPEAKIHISYALPNDFLSSLVVTKYDSADDVPTKSTGKDANASIVRFHGGLVVWQIGVERSVLGQLPVLGKDKHTAPRQVKYGSVPAEFTQANP